MTTSISCIEKGNALKKHLDTPGEVYPGLFIYITGANMKQRLYNYFASCFAEQPLLVVPKKDGVASGYEHCWFGNKEEVLEALGENISFVFSAHLVPCVNLKCYAYIALQPVYDVAGYRMGEEPSLKDWVYSLDDKYIQAASCALDFCTTWINDVHLIRRYIQAVYPTMYKMKQTSDQIAQDSFWTPLLGHTVRLVAYPRKLNDSFSLQLLNFTDDKYPESLADSERVQVDLKVYDKAQFAVNVCDWVLYCVMDRQPWTCAPTPARDTVDIAGSSWIETEACKGRLSRAYFKLEEAFLLLSNQRTALQPVVERYGGVWGWWELTEEAQAVLARREIVGCDVGAAPGGWSYSLAKRGAQVLSVDPGPLSLQHPSITYVPALLEEGSVQAHLSAKPLDVLVCDMNNDISGTIKLLMDHVVLKGHMKPGSLFIVTVKVFMQQTMDEDIDTALKQLGVYFDCVQTVWLFANRKERTILAIRNNTPIE